METKARLRRFYPALIKRLSTVAEERSILSNERAALVSERDFLRSSVNHLTAERNNLSAQVNSLAGERNDLVGWVNTVIAERNDLIEKVNALIRERNELTGQVNNLTGERNDLVGRVNALTADHAELTGKVHALNAERYQFIARIQAASFAAKSASFAEYQPRNGAPVDPASPAGSAISTSSPATRTVATRKAKFLIVSNMRSGSTFLETLLGSLPDVYTDFEVKWLTPYTPAPTHYVIDKNGKAVSDFLAGLENNSPIVGSKLVFDEYCMTPAEFKYYWDRIGADVRIVHLTRNYREVFLSRHRGFFHKLNKGLEHSIGPHLKEAIINADIRLHSIQSPRRINPVDCYHWLSSYLLNDAQIHAAREPEREYLLVDYSDIHRRISEIVDFIGSRATKKLIERSVSAPPTLKLPPINPMEVVSNIDELELYFEHFENLRGHLLGTNEASHVAEVGDCVRR